MIYCECETPVMDVEHDSGCRRCGRPVDFSPRLECLDGPEGCKGKVEYRLTSDRARTDFKSFPRCEAHFEKREAKAREAVEAGYFADTVPEWFDASYAGERWEEEY